MTRDELQKCAEACLACSLACDYGTNAFLKSEYSPKLKRCITSLLECSTICRAAVAVMSQEGAFSERLGRMCIEACDYAMQVCEAHVQWEPEQAKACAEACRRCSDVCEGILNYQYQVNGHKQRL